MSTDKKKLKKKADEWFSKYIRYRDGKKINGEWQSECITCGVWKPLKQMQNGHFMSRAGSKLRYDEQNCNAQCMPCNVMKHGDQFNYALKLNLKYGDGTAARLFNQRHENYKLTIEELEQIIKDAKEYIKEMEEL